jgi:hypothetical protein
MDTLLTRITLKEDGNYSNRISSFTPQEKKNLYQWYKGLTGKEKKIIDDGYSDNSSKMKPGRVLKAVKPDDETDPMYGIDDENDKAVNYFVDFILIPSIRVANDNPRTSERLHELFKKLSSGSSLREEVGGGGGPVQRDVFIEEVGGGQVVPFEEVDHTDRVVNNFTTILEEFIDETNETGPQMLLNILCLLLNTGVRALRLLSIISKKDKEDFINADYEEKVFLVWDVFLRTFFKLISYTIGKFAFFLIVVLVLYQCEYGKLLINSILSALLLTLKFFGLDVDSYLLQIQEKFQELQEDMGIFIERFLTNILSNALFSIFKSPNGKTRIVEVLGERLTSDEVRQIVNEIVTANSANTAGLIAETAANTQGLIAETAANTQGLIAETAAIHSGELVQSTTMLARQILNSNGRQLLTFLGPFLAASTQGKLEGILHGLDGKTSMDDLEIKVREVNLFLDDILRDSHFTLYEALTARRELTPDQIESIVEITVDRLKTQDPNLIRGTIEGLQRILTDTTARALMAAPAIQNLLNVGPRRLMDRGGRRTRKARKSRKARKAKRSRKSRKSRISRKSRKTKKDKKKYKK